MHIARLYACAHKLEIIRKKFDFINILENIAFSSIIIINRKPYWNAYFYTSGNIMKVSIHILSENNIL